MSNKAYLETVLGTAPRVQMVAAPADGVRVEKIPVELLDGDPHQPRKYFDDSELAELAASMKLHGQLQPARARKVSGGRYMIVAGERRLRAARLAGLPTLDVIVLDERVSMDRVRVEAAVENLQRSDLTPLEAAEGYRDLIKLWGVSQAELARRLGIGAATVSRALALLDAPEEARARIAAGESVRQAVPPKPPQRRRTAKPDKRRAVVLELRAGSVRLKRGATVEQLVAELQAMQTDRADAA